MNVLILLIFVCVILVGAAVAFFAWTVGEQTFDHTDRLALLPLEDEQAVPSLNTDTDHKEGKDGDSTNRL